MQPTSRSQTHTPASVPNDPGPPSRPPSRPLSRTFSRLGRSLSRSLSRHSRSLSRPASLILDKTITGSSLSGLKAKDSATEGGVGDIEQRERSAGAGLGTLEFDAEDPGYLHSSATSAGNASAAGGAESSDVVSPWSEPETLDFTDLEGFRSATPARLGVLPSPTGESFVGSWKEDRPRTAVEGGAQDDLVDAAVTARSGSDFVASQSPRTPTQRMFLGSRGGRKEREDADEDLYNITPTATRIPAVGRPRQESRELAGVVSRTGGEEETNDDGFFGTTAFAAADRGFEGQKDGEVASQMDDAEETDATPLPSDVSAQQDEDSRKITHDMDPVLVTRDSGVVGLDQATNDDQSQSEVSSARGPASFQESTSEAGGVELDASQDYSVLTQGAAILRFHPMFDKELPRLPSNISNATGDNFVDAGPARTADFVATDSGSVVSSTDDFHDAPDVAEPAGQGENQSRRSSVSSLFTGDDPEPATAVQLHLPQQLGPPTQVDRNSSHGAQSLRPERPDFERPHSYVELGTDASGVPLQESLDIKQASSSNVNLREVPTSPTNDRGKKRFSFAGASPPQRNNAVHKGRRPTLTSPTSIMAASHISDHFGLEDLQHNMETGRADSLYREPEIDDKQEKRRSSVWGALKRGSSKSKTDSRRAVTDPAVGMNPPGQMASSSATTTATAPQRASTTAADSDAKKKRFSGLGSLFSRSSTTTGRKLEKKGKQRYSQVIDPMPPIQKPATDASEARRRQDFSHQQARLPEVFPPMQSSQPQQAPKNALVYSDDVDDWRDPPPSGWYGPKNQGHAGSPRQVSQPPKRYRQLHSERGQSSAPLDWNEYTVGDYPGSAYSAGPYPRDARPDLSSASGQRSAPTADGVRVPPRPTYSQQSSNGSYGRRHSSYVSDAELLSPQVSGQSEWESLRSQQQRSSSSSFSPIQPRSAPDGLPPPGRFRVGSITEELSREVPGLAMTTDDRQQTPWAISMPADPVRQQTESAPTTSQYASISGDNYAWSNDASNENYQARPSTYQPSGTIYADAPRADNYTYPTYDSHPSSGNPRGPPYRQQMPPPITTRFSQSERYYPAQYERQRSGGYTGRRDEPTANEDAVVMRGTSYPGQEWSPYSA